MLPHIVLNQLFTVITQVNLKGYVIYDDSFFTTSQKQGDDRFIIISTLKKYNNEIKEPLLKEGIEFENYKSHKDKILFKRIGLFK